MTAAEFAVVDWIDRLVPALSKLAEAQKSYLQEYYTRNPGVRLEFDMRRGNRPPFPLDDVRMLYAMAYHSHVFGEEEYYAPLCAVLDPVRVILRSHPTLAHVVNPIIGRDEFWREILHSGHAAPPTDLIAGVMARAAELSGDRFRTAAGHATSPTDLIAGLMVHATELSGDSFRTAAGELNRLLTPAAESGLDGVQDGLDVGYDAVLFYGLTLKERIDIVKGMAILPFEQVRAFVDEDFVEKLAPSRAPFSNWRSVGALVRPFRWRPLLRRTGYRPELKLRNLEPFFRDAQTFLELLAVAHAAPVLSIAALGDCIDRSASRLLGLEGYRGSEHGHRSAERFDGFEECPDIDPEALAQARSAFETRKSERYAQIAPITSRLSDALARDGGFADEGRIVGVAISLERMYDLPQRRISLELRNRASAYLGSDSESREEIKESVKEFYDSRSNIVHSRSDNVSLQRNRESFGKGFDIAKRTLFKLLHKGPPDDWDELVTAGD